ncbi:hypothetical protein QVD17_00689 [Tagetes erecta]|uniref:Uncharacterized protein n=1 Tax=Tagetes erecta TaxID=13708 RepID=A0AAD8L689_TARER|nr:hypothetical protein QVD17_00689 [Tagetes erecta]
MWVCYAAEELGSLVLYLVVFYMFRPVLEEDKYSAVVVDDKGFGDEFEMFVCVVVICIDNTLRILVSCVRIDSGKTMELEDEMEAGSRYSNFAIKTHKDFVVDCFTVLVNIFVPLHLLLISVEISNEKIYIFDIGPGMDEVGFRLNHCKKTFADAPSVERFDFTAGQEKFGGLRDGV